MLMEGGGGGTLRISNPFTCSWKVGGGGGDLKDFKFGTFIGCFPSDGVASMAVKWLIEGWSLMRASLTWKHEREGVRQSGIKSGMVPGDSLTWKHKREGVRKSSLKREMVCGESFTDMETWKGRCQKKCSLRGGQSVIRMHFYQRPH